MDINILISIIKKKISENIRCQSIEVDDKTFLHKNHIGNEQGKFHIKLTIQSEELMKINRIERNKKIYKILNNEMKEIIHSLQILIH
tara:strand:+ start:345 stop:605 length:261 start_codon:yes stop_codon:yes gene_type:complete